MPTPNASDHASSDSRHTYAVDDHLIDVTLHEPAPGEVDIPEALVQDIWRTQLFEHELLTTVRNRPLHVIYPGVHNHDSGPDFSQAHLRIDGLDWHGDVEVHIHSAGWYAHGHDQDRRSNRVVLHVSLYADEHTGALKRPDGSLIPELILRPHLRTPLRGLLHQFHTAPAELPCARQWSTLARSSITDWVEYLALQRLRDKAERLATYPLEPFGATPASEWDQMLHAALFEALGYVPNRDAMRALATRLPLAFCQPIPDALDLEALHFGVAGLLPAPDDLLDSDRPTADYAMHLRDRFAQLNATCSLPLADRTMDRTAWKFHRLRPANFPTLRIAQATALLAPGGLLHDHPFDAVCEAIHADDPLPALRALLAATPSSFWTTHYRLDRSSQPHNPALGSTRTDIIITNAVLPVLYRYAEATDDASLRTRVRDVLHSLPAARNVITRIYADLNYRASSAFEAQGLHHLHTTYCQPGRCLSCPIGMHMLSKDEPFVLGSEPDEPQR